MSIEALDIRKEVIKKIRSSMPGSVDFIEKTLSVPPDIKFGDFAVPCFPYAKELGKSPAQIAQEISEKITPDNTIQKVEVKGPYLNIFINRQNFTKKCLDNIDDLKDDFGKEPDKNENILIDYSAPNVAKNMGIHNLRSTIIGQALYNVYAFLGYNTIGINHIGDWGTQFGKLIWALEKWSSPDELKSKGITFLNEMYVIFHEKYEQTKDDTMLEDARAWFRRIEQGDKRAVMWWKLFIDVSLQDYDKIYGRLGINFDYTTGESFYMQFLDDTLKRLEKKGLLQEDDGAQVIKFEEEDMPPLLLKKRDGATLYGTRDMAAAFYRLENFKPKKVLYVTDISQRLHFRQVFKALEMVDPKNKEIFEHVDFGRLSFAETKMSTRKGNIIPLREVLDKAHEKSLSLIKEKSESLDNKDEVAEKVGIGAVIFGDLLHDRLNNIVFDWDKILDFQGETAPYIQYTYARIKSILRKEDAKKSELKTEYYEILSDDESFRIIKKLYKFNSVLKKTVEQKKPSVLARYVLELSQLFNSFYVNNPILNQDEPTKKIRLFFIEQVSIVLKNSMELLNISMPEKM